MSRARFGFSAHPDALADLRALPTRVRDLALVELQALVHGGGGSLPLDGPLHGCHKIYVDPEADWRMVIQFRDASPGAEHRREVHLVAVGPRESYSVYRDAQFRLGRDNSNDQPGPVQLAAARARSPHAARVRAEGAAHEQQADITDAPHSTAAARRKLQ
ncbi:hypothetical protein OG783_28840 [Streptomyces jietaisiensis]|uniref:hypothetical protein n=1 Tax=Streptomyces griseoaurantiacus TaxID=68213 RepID=UPI003250E515